MKNRFKYTVHKFVDYPGDKAPEDLIDKISDFADYKDTVSSENLFSQSSFEECAEILEDELSAKEKQFLLDMLVLLAYEEAAYIRFIFS